MKSATPTAKTPPTAKTLSRAALDGLVAKLVGSGTTVVAPSRAAGGAVVYAPIRSVGEVVLDGPLPRLSAKPLFLPPTEPLFAFQEAKGDVEIIEAPVAFPPTVLLGVRPCDAAALEILDRVMGWDYRDEPWFGRRTATTVVALACPGVDSSCFCTAVGLGPDSTRGADWRLTPVGEGFLVDLLTEKGTRLAQAQGGLEAPRGEAEAEGYRQRAREAVARNLQIAPERIRSWIEGHFEDPLWGTLALRCHGCGACAFLCPTCHCFDIVDEPEGVGRGTRRRNWDTCQTGLFTLHGSGHNPRRDQCARYRQRVNHKFAIYPARFQEVLCTGCGRCVRACPGGMDLLEVLGVIDRLAATPPAARQGGAA